MAVVIYLVSKRWRLSFRSSRRIFVLQQKGGNLSGGQVLEQLRGHVGA